MKNLICFFLLLITAGSTIGIISSCSEENDCSLTGRPMMYCVLKTINPDNENVVLNDTLDSLTITALGTDSIILNNQKKVHTLMLPLRYTSDTTVFIFKYDPKRQPRYADTLYIVQSNSPYFQSIECGYMMKQNILSAKIGQSRYTPGGDANQVDRMKSVDILNKEANTNEIQNLQIFYQYRDRTPTIE